MGIPWSLDVEEACDASLTALMRKVAITAVKERLHAKTNTVNSPIFKGKMDCICCKDSGNYTRKLVVDIPRELS